MRQVNEPSSAKKQIDKILGSSTATSFYKKDANKRTHSQAVKEFKQQDTQTQQKAYDRAVDFVAKLEKRDGKTRDIDLHDKNTIHNLAVSFWSMGDV